MRDARLTTVEPGEVHSFRRTHGDGRQVRVDITGAQSAYHRLGRHKIHVHYPRLAHIYATWSCQNDASR